MDVDRRVGDGVVATTLAVGQSAEMPAQLARVRDVGPGSQRQQSYFGNHAYGAERERGDLDAASRWGW